MAETTNPKPRKSNREELLALLDYVHTRIVERLKDLTVEEYLWEPVEGCWSVRPGEDGVFRAERPEWNPEPAPFTTIAWRMWHIGADCLGGYCVRFWERRGGGGAGAAAGFGEGAEALGADTAQWPGTPEGALAEMNRQWSRFRAHVAPMDDTALAEPLGPTAGPYAEDSYHALVLHALDEVIHHGAEMALIRDLYRASAGGASWRTS